MPITLALADPAPAPVRPPRRRRIGPASAVIAFALVVIATAYLVRAASSDAEATAYVEFPVSDAQDVDTAPEAATGPVGIPLADAAAQATLDRVVAASDLAASPGQLALRAQLLLQRAAVTGDADSYARALASLDQAVASAPGDLDLLAARAAARVTTHDFAGAATDAQRVLAVIHDHLGALGAAYDAAFETGQYADAEGFLAALARLAPASPQVLFRQARWAALGGDPVGAATIAARARAIATTTGIVGTARAGYDLLVGKLALDEGRYAIALGAYESALAAAPGWHAALAGLGRARAASGDLVGAEEALAASTGIVPLPETLTALGDVRTALGDTAGAEVAYGTVDVVARLESVQQLASRAIVLSRADRGVDTDAAVRDARAELRVRQDVYGYDALAWALLADGQAAEAATMADRALALGTLDPRLLLHAGLAHAANGDEARATELLRTGLDLSPTLDPLLTERARAALAGLGTAS
ncbi:MAG: tetratricopeptide repeat protein [Actinomycetota bacterium]|nr:tetratricopeptide repeat protein [Actinomycetota bacterium]